MALRILYVESDPEAAEKFEVFFQQLGSLTDLNLLRVNSAKEAMTMLASLGGDVVLIGREIAGEEPLAFAKLLARKMPLIDSAVVSTLPADDFHEETEGLGVFMQLPPEPGPDEAGEFLGKIQKIRQLLEA